MPSEPVVHHSGPGYETRDANVRGVVIFAVGLLGLIVLAAVAMLWVFHYFSRTQSLGSPASPFVNERPLPPPPRLQVEPRTDLDHLRDHETSVLNSYGWVDPKSGVVRIPIDRAMTLLLEKRLPVRASPSEPRP